MRWTVLPATAAVATALLLVPTDASAQDTLTVRADNPPVWGENPQLVEEVRIGALEGDEAYTFGYITGLTVGADGVIWVADGQIDFIRRYHPDGTHIDNVGRKGEGPGEFDRLDRLRKLPDGRIAVYMEGPHSISFFDPNGTYLHRVPVRKNSIGNAGDTFQVDSSGVLYVGMRIRENGVVRGMVYARMNMDGEILDSLQVPRRNADGPRFGGQRYFFGPMAAFSAMTHSHMSPLGYLVEGRNDQYHFTLPLKDGRTLRIERSWEPIQVKRDERRSYQALEEHFAGRNSASGSTVPDVKPPFWGFWVDDAGRIWAATHSEGVHIPETPEEKAFRESWDNPPSEWWEPLVFDVIEPTGRFLGTLHFPNRQTRPMVSRGNLVWVLEKGEWDEQYVVRYRIVPG